MQKHGHFFAKRIGVQKLSTYFFSAKKKIAHLILCVLQSTLFITAFISAGKLFIMLFRFALYIFILHTIFSKGNRKEIKSVFSLGIILLSDEEIIPYERYNAPLHAKIGTSDK